MTDEQPKNPRVRLQALGERRAQWLEVQQEVSRELERDVPAAHRDGVPVSEIARLTGLSRQGVYDLLERTSARGG
jgi:predicted DNA-binding protein YlxM (UPF0122 family)